MPDPINDTIAALTAAGANDDEITAIIKEKFGGWRPGADSLSSIKLRGVQGPISDTPEKEPDTYWGGFFRSLKNEFSPSTVRDNLIKSPAMQGAAHPETAGDIANLLIPSGIEGAMSAAGTMRRSLGGAIKPGSKLKDVPRQVIERVRDRWTDPLDLGERAMRDAPLHQQMNIMEGPPVRAEAVRTGTPPYRPEPPPVPFHERPLYQQMNDLPETQAPILGRGADAPYQPTPTLAKPTGPPPVLRKAPTVDEILIEKLTETPGAPTRVSAAPEQALTKTGRPSVTAAEQAAIEERAAGRGSPRVEEITPDAELDLGTTSGFEPTTMSEEAVAARKARAGGAEPIVTPGPPAETSSVGQQLRDSLVEEARKKRQQSTVNDILDYHGRNNMPGVSRKQAAQVDTRMAPHNLSGEAAERIAGKVSEGLTSPEARQSLIEYYNSARDDLFKNRLGQAMRDAGILPPQ